MHRLSRIVLRKPALLQLIVNGRYHSSSDMEKMSFAELIQIRQSSSLTIAAKRMANLQIESEQINRKMEELEQIITEHPLAHQALADKIKSVQDNIRLQEEENQSIEKRAQKELIDTQKYSVSKIAKEVIEISDNLQRSCKHAAEDKTPDSRVQQIVQLKEELHQLLGEYGIKEFNPKGQDFDPNTQESLLKIPLPENLSPEEKKLKSHTVVECSRTGFTIHGRLLRSAHVCIYQ